MARTRSASDEEIADESIEPVLLDGLRNTELRGPMEAPDAEGGFIVLGEIGLSGRVVDRLFVANCVNLVFEVLFLRNDDAAFIACLLAAPLTAFMVIP